ncbi:MAG: manganese efflux pump MntP family protein [Candidatus Zixiibacteriota bacterium]
MDVITLILIAIGLAMDAFAVSIASSIIIGKVNKRQVFRLSFHFGLFQATMPVIGWLAGRTVLEYISGLDHWVAFGLLGFIGGKAIYESFNGTDDNHQRSDPSKGFSLVLLSTATSIDALAVGLSFAVLNVTIWYPSLIIGVITGGLSLIGVLLGSRLGRRFGKRMEIIGGLVLIGIGIKILIDHFA